MNITKKIQTDKNGYEYILFRIDVYLLSIFQPQNLRKGHIDRDLIFEEKRQEALENKLGCKVIRINTRGL